VPPFVALQHYSKAKRYVQSETVTNFLPSFQLQEFQLQELQCHRA
jgi:hypothetical protein